MNSRQEKFARLVAAGKSQVDAYREAYPRSRNWKEGTARKRASELMKRGAVAEMVERLRRDADSAATMDCNRARVILSAEVERIVADHGPTIELCRAIDTLARISGWCQQAAQAVAVAVAQPPMTQEERERRICDILGMPYPDEPEPPPEELERRHRRAREEADARYA